MQNNNILDLNQKISELKQWKSLKNAQIATSIKYGINSIDQEMLKLSLARNILYAVMEEITLEQIKEEPSNDNNIISKI